MLIICSSIASFGAYSPLFFMSQHGAHEGYDIQDLVLLQTFLGLSIAFGIVASGSTINKIFTIAYRKINISRQYVCQVCIIFILLLPSAFRFLFVRMLHLLPAHSTHVALLIHRAFSISCVPVNRCHGWKWMRKRIKKKTIHIILLQIFIVPLFSRFLFHRRSLQMFFRRAMSIDWFNNDRHIHADNIWSFWLYWLVHFSVGIWFGLGLLPIYNENAGAWTRSS